MWVLVKLFSLIFLSLVFSAPLETSTVKSGAEEGTFLDKFVFEMQDWLKISEVRPRPVRKRTIRWGYQYKLTVVWKDKQSVFLKKLEFVGWLI